MTVDAWFEYWIKNIKGKTVRWNTLSSYKGRYEKNIKDVIGNMLLKDVKHFAGYVSSGSQSLCHPISARAIHLSGHLFAV